MKDPTAFRQRVAAYRLGKLPYLAGRPVDDDEEEFLSTYDFIKKFEGDRDTVYLDSKGIKTVGMGFTDKELIKAVEARRVGNKPGKITDEERLIYYNKHITEAEDTVRSKVPLYDKMSPEARTALLSYYYNYPAGYKGGYLTNESYVKRPTRFIEALHNRDYKTAAKEMDAGMNDKNSPGLRTRRLEELKYFLHDGSPIPSQRPITITLDKRRKAFDKLVGNTVEYTRLLVLDANETIVKRSKLKPPFIKKYEDGKSPYDDDRIYTTSNYMLPELVITPTKDSPEELAVEQAYEDRFKNRRLEIPVDRTNESLHNMYKHIQKGRAEAFPYVVLALTLPMDLAGVGDLANLAQWTYKSGRKLLQRLIQPTLKLPIIEDFGKVLSKYKLKPLPYDERYDIEQLVNKPKLPDYSESDRFMNFVQLVLEHLKYAEALKRVNKAPDQPIPIESQNIVRKQVIPRRLKSYISSQETDGVKRMKKFLEEHGIDDINVSNPELLKILENENITLEELTDWANYKDYERQLNDYVNGKFSEIDLDDWEIAHPSEANSLQVTAGDFNPKTDAIRYVNRGHNEARKIGTLAHEMRHWMDKYVPLLQSERNALLNAYGTHSFPHTVPNSDFVTTNVDLRNVLLGNNYANNASLKVQNDILNNFISDEEILNALQTVNSYGNEMYKNAISRLDALKQRLINQGWSQESISHLIKNLKHKWAEDLRYALTNVGSYALPMTIGGTALYEASKENKKVNPVQ